MLLNAGKEEIIVALEEGNSALTKSFISGLAKALFAAIAAGM